MSDAGSRPDIRIFISYRRDDTAGHAGRLYDALIEHYGEERVFMDLAVIEPGVDFVDVIHEGVGSCDVVLTLIGRNWLEATDAKGRKRLENPEDFVRLELETALHREIRVIPVLVHGAQMPGSDELPTSLSRLARRNGLELSDPRWAYDVGRLIAAIDRIAADKAARAAPPLPPPGGPPAEIETPAALAAATTESFETPAATGGWATGAVTEPLPVGSAVPGPPPPPAAVAPPTGPTAPPGRGGRRIVPFAVGGVLLAGLVVAGVLLLGGDDDPTSAPPTSPPTTVTTPPSTPTSPPTTTPGVAADVQFLLDHVPSEHADSCVQDEEFLPDGATVGIVCEQEEVTLWYYQYPGDAGLQDWYAQRLTSEAIERGVGSCETADTSEEGVIVDGVESRGRLMCYTDDRGRWAEWTVPELLIYAYANRADGDKQQLYDFWRGAGPTQGA